MNTLSTATFFGHHNKAETVQSWETMFRMDHFLEAAIEEAQLGLHEGGIPIGSVLVYEGKIIGRGHNRRRDGSP